MANATNCGIYDDTANEWHWLAVNNGGSTLYYNGSARLATTTGGITVTGTGTATDWALSSDRKLKKQIKDLKLRDKDIRWRQFKFKESGAFAFGVIADEVEDVYPELVQADPETGMKSVKYHSLYAHELAKKDLQIQNLNKRVDILEKENDEMKVRLDRLELILEKLL